MNRRPITPTILLTAFIAGGVFELWFWVRLFSRRTIVTRADLIIEQHTNYAVA